MRSDETLQEEAMDDGEEGEKGSLGDWKWWVKLGGRKRGDEKKG